MGNLRSLVLYSLIASAFISCTVTARRKGHGRHTEKTNDWDALDSLLKRADRGDDQSETVNEEQAPAAVEPRSRSEESNTENGEKEVKKNPCENHQCGWGKECIVHGTKTKCECIRRCPTSNGVDPFEKACSNTNETFENMCELYKERCLCRRDDAVCGNPEKNKHLHIEYMGSCKNLEPCTQELLEQFPIRMADWLFQVMRDLKKRQELHGDKWQRMIDEAESDDHLKHVYPVIWKFCDLDTKPHDKSVTHHELIPITAPVMPMESCIKPFLKGCDSDGDEKITLKEWGKCLGLKEEEIAERC
jgi:hypothetical protein